MAFGNAGSVATQQAQIEGQMQLRGRMDNVRDWFMGHAEWFSGSGVALSALIGFVLSARQPLNSALQLLVDYWQMAFIVSVALSSFGLLLTSKRQARLDDLKREIECKDEEIATLKDMLRSTTMGYLDACDDACFRLAGRFGLMENARVSLYKHDARSSCFFCIGRWSRNPDFKEKSRTHTYHRGEGCLDEAWRQGTSVVRGLASYDIDPDRYIQEQMARGVPRERILGFQMKSREYAGFALHTANGRERVAVAVFECTEVGVLPIDQLEQYFEDDQEDRIAAWLVSMDGYDPCPSLAKESGF